MRYTLVKQFSNAAIDNAYTFVFKIVDFGKVLVEFFFAFLEIWIAFFLIFYNIFMYIYYLTLFFIDRGTESSGSMIRWRGMRPMTTRAPTVKVSKGATTVPGMYGARKAAVSAAAKTADAAGATVETVRSFAKVKGKGSFFRSVGDFFVDLFKDIGRIIAAPFKALVLFFEKIVQSRKEKETVSKSGQEGGGKKSLIDEYIKEYEQKRKN